MNDLKFAFCQLLKNPGFTAVDVTFREPTRLLPHFLHAVAGCDFQTGHKHDVNDLVIIRLIVAVNEQFAPAGSQSDAIFMLHEQPTAVSNVNQKRTEGLYMKQSSNFVSFHLFDDSLRRNRGKRRKTSCRPLIARPMEFR